MTEMMSEKYRPIHVADIVGQERTKKMIGAWLRQDRIPRAVLIEGEFSSGKTSISRILARAALCQEPKNGEACGKCRSCQSFDKGNHPDFIEMNAASERGIADMRSLTKKLPVRPLFGKKKIVVLDEAHMITNPGWQAMLKVLEEPPSHVVIIVLTTNPEKIPKTIVSRCSKLKLSEVLLDECVELLSRVASEEGLSKAGLDKTHLRKLASAVGCHPRNALHALDQVYTLASDAVPGGGQVDSALINSFIKDVAVPEVEDVAIAVFKCIFTGKHGAALKRAEDVSNDADRLLTVLTELHRQAMMKSFSKKLVDPYYAEVLDDGLEIFNYTSAKSERHLEARTAILDAYACFTDLRIKTSNFNVPVAEVIGEAVARASLIVRAFIEKAQDSKNNE